MFFSELSSSRHGRLAEHVVMICTILIATIEARGRRLDVGKRWKLSLEHGGDMYPYLPANNVSCCLRLLESTMSTRAQGLPGNKQTIEVRRGGRQRISNGRVNIQINTNSQTNTTPSEFTGSNPFSRPRSLSCLIFAVFVSTRGCFVAVLNLLLHESITFHCSLEPDRESINYRAEANSPLTATATRAEATTANRAGGSKPLGKYPPRPPWPLRGLLLMRSISAGKLVHKMAAGS